MQGSAHLTTDRKNGGHWSIFIFFNLSIENPPHSNMAGAFAVFFNTAEWCPWVSQVIAPMSHFCGLQLCLRFSGLMCASPECV